MARLGPLAGALVGFALVAWGALACIAGQQPPQQNALSVAALEAGQSLPGPWVEITGRLLREDRIIWRGDETRETYVPLVAPEWRRGQPVAVFVRAREDNWGQPGRLLKHPDGGVAGLAAGETLDTDLAQRFAEFEMPPRRDALIVDYEAQPGAQNLLLGYFALAIGGAVLLVTGVVWLIKR
jgi:hypothetical protein